MVLALCKSNVRQTSIAIFYLLNLHQLYDFLICYTRSRIMMYNHCVVDILVNFVYIYGILSIVSYVYFLLNTVYTNDQIMSTLLVQKCVTLHTSGLFTHKHVYVC